MFLSHPSAAVPMFGIALLAYMRLQQPLGVLDAAVGASVVALWLIQEWVVHKWLLHSSFDWAGKTIHKEHHEQPYHHVSLDPPALVISVMLLAAAVFAVLLGPSSPLWLTATAAYWSAGVVYEWLHYIVHTRWVPPAGWRGKWLRDVRRHHMLHHMRNEHYWLSFSAPPVDALFGTLPARSSSVPITDMARTAHGSAAIGAARHHASTAGKATSTAAAPAGGHAAVEYSSTMTTSSSGHGGSPMLVGAGAASGVAVSAAAQRQ